MYPSLLASKGSSSAGGCPQISPEQSEQLCAKLLVRPGMCLQELCRVWLRSFSFIYSQLGLFWGLADSSDL